MVTVRPEAIVHGGAAMGRLDDGRAVFVHGGLPGELAEVRLTDARARHASGVLTAVLGRQSPARTTPRCPYYLDWPQRGLRPAYACGGCIWQHVTYDAQLEYKRSVMEDALRRIGGIAEPPVAAVLGIDDPWHCRNHVRLRATGDGLAFVAVDGRSLVKVADCDISHPLVLELLALATELGLPWGASVRLRAGIATGDQMLVIETPAGLIEEVDVDTDVSVAIASFEANPQGREASRSSDAGEAGLDELASDPSLGELVSLDLAAGRPFLVEAVAGRQFLIPPTGFFQTNTLMAEHLVALVKAAVPPSTERLVDLYSGVGLLAAHLAAQCGEVIAVELDPAAVAAGVENASDLANLTYVEGDAAEGLAWVEGEVQVAVVDPPRSGLGRDVLDALASRVHDRIVYASCEPSTLARDAARLARSAWQLESCQPIDMFAQTGHIESVNVFVRQGRVK